MSKGKRAVVPKGNLPWLPANQVRRLEFLREPVLDDKGRSAFTRNPLTKLPEPIMHTRRVWQWLHPYYRVMFKHLSRSKYAPKRDEGQPGWRRRMARAAA